MSKPRHLAFKGRLRSLSGHSRGLGSWMQPASTDHRRCADSRAQEEVALRKVGAKSCRVSAPAGATRYRVGSGLRRNWSSAAPLQVSGRAMAAPALRHFPVQALNHFGVWGRYLARARCASTDNGSPPSEYSADYATHNATDRCNRTAAIAMMASAAATGGTIVGTGLRG